MTIIAVGIGLPEHVFAIDGVDESGRAALVRLTVSRDKLVELIAARSACVIGIEGFGQSVTYHVFLQRAYSMGCSAERDNPDRRVRFVRRGCERVRAGRADRFVRPHPDPHAAP